MRHADYVNMSLLDALHLAVRLSGKNIDEVGAAMGWNPGNTARIFGQESYWPTLPSLPRFCVVVGNNVLIDWLHAQAHAGGVQHEFPALNCPGLLTDMNHLTCDLGDVAKECERAVANRNIAAAEASRLIKRLLTLCTDTVHTIRGLRPIAGGPGTGND
jgi:hypothetical protein